MNQYKIYFAIFTFLFANLIFLVQTFSQTRDCEFKVDSLNSAGDYLRNSEPRQAMNLLNQALLLADSINYTSGKIKALDHIGVQYKKFGIFDESLRYHFLALSLLPVNDSSMTKAYILNNIANTYQYLKKFNEAEELYLESLAIKTKLNDSKQMAYTFMKLGLVNSEMGNYERARHYSLHALEIEQKNNDSAAVSNALASLGFVELKNKNYNKSIDYLKQSLELKLTFPEQLYGIAENQIWIAQNYIQLGKYSLALDYLSGAKKYAIKINSQILLLDIYYTFFELNRKSNNLNRALEFLIKADSLNNEIKSEVALGKIAQFITVYSLEKKEQENQNLKQENLISELKLEQQTYLKNILIIAILSAIVIIILMFYNIKTNKQKNKEIEKQKNILEKLNAKLEEANATKDKFFTIIAHDLKNPLGTLLGFGDLIGKEFDTLDSDEKKTIIKSMSNSSRIINAMLENLLTWARSQRNQIEINLQPTDISNLIDQVVSELREMALSKNIKLDNCANNIGLVYIDKEMMKIVLHNLINNAIKFTQKGGVVNICSEIKNGELLINVADNGSGIPETNLNKLFKIDSKISTPGTNNESGTGLGLILCKEFIEKHGGNIRAANGKNGGAIFTISIPD